MSAAPSNSGPATATILDVVARRAREEPGRVAFRFEGRDHTFREIWARAGAVAACLASRGIRVGERVVLVLPNGPGFFATFFGAQRTGAIPVPLFPGSGPERVRDLAGACGARVVVVAARADRRALEPRAGGPEVIPLDETDSPGAGPFRTFPATHPALLQYTSGSTGEPKAVVISHANLATNVRQMIVGMEITETDVFVSWLPVHHDMGLVLMALAPFTVGARLVLLESRLTDVRRWLEALDRHRGTFTAAPDFAYRLCLAAVRDPSRFDLTSLRVALDAAEPVRATTIQRFEAAFGLARVMVPGYGLAEATVGVSMQRPGTPLVVSEQGLVAIGRPFPGIRLHVVVGDRPAAMGETGELVVESPANTMGYFRDRRATARLFYRPGWIRTGDLAFRDARGEVFLVDRAKHIILQAGRNLAPRELEETVETLPFVRRAAAVGIDRGRAEGEQAYLFAELRRPGVVGRAALREMARRVVVQVHRRVGLRPGRVILLRPRSIPLTPNGKLRRDALRAAYRDGSLGAAGRILYPEGGTASG